MAGDDDGMESFEINDYDINSALNPGRRPRFTKEQQIYGMWADRDSDEEDFGGRGFGGKKKKDYSAPVNFVSGGVKVGDKITEKDQNSDEDSPITGPDSSIRISGFSRGTGGSERSGLGGSKLQRKQKTAIINEAEFAGLRSGGGGGRRPVQTGKDFGDWERHTRGIGSKLLEKMGYRQGKGLGKEGQGIAQPVEAKLRPGRGAVGAYGAEAKGPKIPRRDGTVLPDEEEEEDEEIPEGKRASGQWRREGGRRKAKYKYRTMEEVIAEGGAMGKRMMGAGGQHSSTKVIDMTGKEQKVYSGYDALATKKREPEEESKGARKFDVPELTYNLDLLVEITEEEIVRNNRQLTFLKDQNVALRHEISELQTSVVNEDEEQDRVAEVLALVESFAEKGRLAELSLEDCSRLFEKLQKDFYQEYKMFGLGDIATTNVLPLIKNAFDGWEPLSEPEHCSSLMGEWRDILEDRNFRGGLPTPAEHMDPYHKLVWEVWMPPVRRAALRWVPRECEPMLKLVETWMGLLPRWILENLLEQIILPKIQTEVENWDPLTDTVPLHSWLHPWLSLMGDRLQPVYPPIRYKLGRALTQWHPRDPSAKNVLKPWVEVFSQGSMDSFLSQNILPKLELCLAAFIVNPADQRLEAWKWILDWMDMISPHVIAHLLLRHFFPKWQEALFTWLSCVNPNYAEISEWYTGWKGMFPQDLIDVPMIKEQFNHALAMMNRAVSGGGVHRAPPTTPAAQKASMAQHKKDMEFLAAAKAAQSAAPANFKDLIERRAVEGGLAFLPVPNKSREGKPVFKFGSELIYVDRNVVFVQKEGGNWEPVGVDELVEMALADS